MSGLNILGGIGQGLQQGVGFMQQKKLQDEHVRQSQARLSMLEEEQNWKRKQQQTAEEERQRVGMLEKINQEELLTYQEETGKTALDRFDLAEVQARAGKKAFQSGFLPSSEYLKAAETQRQLRESGISDLYLKTAINDDWDGFNAQFSKMMGGATAKPMGDAIVVTRPDGQQSQISRIGFESLLKMDLTSNAQKRAFEQEEAVAKLDKTRAEAEQSRAQAGKYRAEARDAGRSAGKSAPANVQAAVWYDSATPEQRAIFDRINKIERQPDVAKAATTVFGQLVDRGADPNDPTTITEARRQARILVGVDDEPAAVTKPGVGKDGIPEPKSAAELKALPSGTKFRAPDGKIKIVP